MRNLAAEVAALDNTCRGALELLRKKYGWYQHGAYADRPGLDLEFSEQLGEDGLPLFERVVQWTTQPQDAA